MSLLNHVSAKNQAFINSDLHSTMSLLNPVSRKVETRVWIKFTFHYVSIKSQGVIEPNIDFATFTFHYVSIKSITNRLLSASISLFTFHYVSIKS